MVTDQEAPPLPLEAGEVVPVPSPALQQLLDAARAATPFERIGYRDPIAAHGEGAIVAVTPWLSDRVLAAFAVRVILHAGAVGDREAAVGVLRKGRPRVPWFVRADVDVAIRQLHQLMPDATWHTAGDLIQPHVPSDGAHPRPRRATVKAAPKGRSHPDDAP